MVLDLCQQDGGADACTVHMLNSGKPEPRGSAEVAGNISQVVVAIRVRNS